MSAQFSRQSPFPAWIIHSKIEPAEPMVSLIDRPRLLQSLVKGLERKLTLISTSPGYGKTALMSQWRRHLLDQGIRVAWLSLDEDDNQPGVLATYLALSLHAIGLRSAIDDMSQDEFGPRLDPRSVVGMLATAAAASDERYVLMLDGFESLKVESTKSVVVPLLRYMPRNIHVAIASQTREQLPLSDYRLSGAVTELNAEDLKFTLSEMAEFLQPLLDKTQLRQVARISAGWPVALQFMKIALTESHDRNSLLRRFSGTREEIRGYFSEHFLNRVPGPQLNFLSESSILDRIDPDSADFIRDRTDSRLLLNDLQDLRGFLVREKTGEQRFRLHPLLRDFLKHQLKLHNFARYRSLHQRAATWTAQDGDVIRAMKYALEAGDKETAAGVVELAGGIARWDIEGMANLRAAHALLPDDIVVKRPRLHLIRALVLLKDGKLTDARHILEQVRNQNASSTDDRLNYEITVVASTLSVYEGSDPAAYVPEIKATLESSADPRAAENAFLYTTICVSGLQYGRFTEAREAANLGLSAGTRFASAYFHLHLGVIDLVQAHVDEAITEYRKAHAIFRRDFNDDKDMKLVTNVLTAEWYFERNDLPRARNLLADTNARLVHGEAWYEIYAAGYTTSSAIAYERDGLEAALRETEGALEYVRKEGLKRLRRLLVANSCGYLTRSREIARARTLVQESGLSLDEYKDPADKNPLIRERFGIVPSLCRLLIAEKRYKRATDELSFFVELEKEIGHKRAVLKFSLLLSLALYLVKKRRRSFDVLNETLSVVRREGFVRLVLDEAPFIVELLEAYVKSRNATERDHGVHLLSLLDNAATDQDVTKLSKREQQVLEELSKGLPDKVIARNLGVTEHTVRFHLKNIFRKLRVHNRLQAVTEATQVV
ncbi:MAG: LuxR C-terminal-related transcriptional regulator [Rhodospirillaceae bacterium]|nr:LuxR C-terminal-related transcriptional regulator [Rhodospirillaceae bacterium]MDD9999585.1 LuxR C-terminal-related transcriptional regulator [Rhodospirillaceae bacterium]MDE0362580.1 LuxR C-terminal-related transcriptional regulator [Rhodospirillaceae bacterium]